MRTNSFSFLFLSGIMFESTLFTHSLIWQILIVCQIHAKHFATIRPKAMGIDQTLEPHRIYILGTDNKIN